MIQKRPPRKKTSEGVEIVILAYALIGFTCSEVIFQAYQNARKIIQGNGDDGEV